MSGIPFVLTALDRTVTMEIAGAVGSGVEPTPVTGHTATVTLSVAANTFKSMFKFQSDSVDFLDADDTDIKYYVYPAFWTDGLVVPGTGVVTETPVGGVVGATLSQDFVRHMAKELFNTYHAVDLFTNEVALTGDVTTKTQTMFNGIRTKLEESDALAVSKPTGMSGTAAPWFRTGDDTTSNFSKTLFQQLISVNKSRLNTFSENANLSAIHSIPFIAGDSISFKLTINAASHATLYSGAEVDPRVYQVTINMS